jgi:IMP cyclohydrolase
MRIVKVARDARTGRFIAVCDAHRRPSTTVVETYRVSSRRIRGRRVKQEAKLAHRS